MHDSFPKTATIPCMQRLQSSYIALMKNPQLWNTNLNSAFQIIALNCTQALNISRASIWFLTDKHELECQVLFDVNEGKISRGMCLSATDFPSYFDAIEHHRILDANNALTDSRTLEFTEPYLKPLNIHAMLDASFRYEGKTEGVICFEQVGQPRLWSQHECNYAISISDLIAQLRIFYALKDSETRYRLLYEQCGDGVFIIKNHQIIDCNQTALSLFGYEKDQLLGSRLDSLSPAYQPDGQLSRDKANQLSQQALQGNEQSAEWLHKREGGTLFYVSLKLNRLELNEETHLIATLHNIDSLKVAQEKVLELNSLRQAIFDSARYSIISTDPNGIILTFNKAAENLLGYTANEMIQRKTPQIIHKASEVVERAKELSTMLGREIQPGFEVFVTRCKELQSEDREWTYIHKDGHEIPVLLSVTALRDADQNITGYLGIAYDITKRKTAESALLASQKELEYRASHDSLTGLANRTQLHTDAFLALQEARNNKHLAALMLLDLDRFKEVNDTLGHHTGDLLLQALGEKLSSVLSSQQAILYRLGGDEFAILMPSISHKDQACTVAKMATQCVRQPFIIEGITLELGGSIGIALFPADGDDSHELLRCADVAMYSAKSQSSGVVVYQTYLDAHSPRRLKLMADLSKAIRDNQLSLYYQPRIDIQTQACVGCEALLRWNHPTLGNIPPAEFIPLAEMSDIIHSLSLWVIETAIQQIKGFAALGINLPIAVNLSARNLIDVSLPSIIQKLLIDHNITAELLEIEITESAFISDPERAETVVGDISQLGIRLAIDDFGTGYSSLSYLKRLPIHTLKVDRSFVADMLSDEQDAAIVRSTIGLAHSFGLNVVAEGVEDHATLYQLSLNNCNQAQGFSICKPLPVEQFIAWLGQHSTRDYSLCYEI